jgi:hypothetical protein
MAIRTGRSVFYHIPKTGGMWVEAAMRGAGLACEPCTEARGHPWRLIGRHATPDGVAGGAGFSFAFVRHPLGWYRSFWAYRVMLRNFSTDDGEGVFPPDACWAEAFDDFVLQCVEAHPSGWISALYRCYLGDEGDRLDYVGRQEHLADDLVRALRLAGEDFDEVGLRATPRRNRAASMPRFADQLELDRHTVQRVLNCERWVMARYY